MKPETKTNRSMTTLEVANRFSELAQKEMWFEIQDELFAENVRSIEPPDSPYFHNAEGKGPVRKKGEDWVSRVRAVHKLSTTQPVVGGNHFTVGRNIDISVEGFGSVKINQIMLYEVKEGQIVLEQFFY